MTTLSATKTPTTPAEAVEQAADIPRSRLVGGFNHVAMVTRDIDRLAAFYRDGFDIPFVELPDPRGRHGFLLLGGHDGDGLGQILHAFEMPEQVTGAFPPADDMFTRGRIDHFAIECTGEVELAEVRDRLVAMGACDGVVRVFGGWFLSLHVVDPDGLRLEIGCARTGEHLGDDDVEIAD